MQPKNIAEQIARNWTELRMAAYNWHTSKSEAGGAKVCICGAGCGGSGACSALFDIRNLLRACSVPEEYKELLELWRQVL
jgi:hypothetical protein